MTNEEPSPKHEDRAETSPASPTTCAMPAWQRRIVLGMLVGLLAFLATLEPIFGYFRGPEWGFHVWEQIWAGYIELALPCLLAAWAAFRRQPLAVRWPWALGLAAGLGLVIAWAKQGCFASYTPPALINILNFPFRVLFFTVFLTIVRRRAGWRIGLEPEWNREEHMASQFSLRQLLLWTTAIAVTLSLDRWISSPQAGSTGDGWADPLQMAISAELVWAVLVWAVLHLPWLLVTVPCVGVVLCPGCRRRFGVWLVVMVLLAFPLLFAAIATYRYLCDPMSFDDFRRFTILAGSIGGSLLGFLPPVLGILGVLRLCGYRLARTKLAGQLVPAAAGPRSWGKRPFPYLVVAMGLLVLVLIPPAQRIAEGRKQARAGAALWRQLKAVGIDAGLLARGGFFSLQFAANQPLAEEGLQLLAKHAEGSELLVLDLAKRQVTDAQLAYLARFPVQTLNLSGNAITDQGFAQFQRLDEVANININLSHTQITDETLQRLAGCRNLSHLNLNGTRVTDAGLKALERTSLNTLRVEQTQVTAAGIAEFSRTHPNCVVSPSPPSPNEP